jgi:hypothetical protein
MSICGLHGCGKPRHVRFDMVEELDDGHARVLISMTVSGQYTTTQAPGAPTCLDRTGTAL